MQIAALSRSFGCIARLPHNSNSLYLHKSHNFNIGTSLPDLRSLLAVPPERQDVAARFQRLRHLDHVLPPELLIGECVDDAAERPGRPLGALGGRPVRHPDRGLPQGGDDRVARQELQPVVGPGKFKMALLEALLGDAGITVFS